MESKGETQVNKGENQVNKGEIQVPGDSAECGGETTPSFFEPKQVRRTEEN